ncbi:MAG: lysophospholipid acyltransferase family protein [Sphingobacteriaceae bacterium]
MTLNPLFWIIYGLLYLISLVPFWLLYLLSDGVFYFLYYVIGYRKQVVRDNLRRSFPNKTEQEQLEIEKTYFRFLSDNLLESVKLLSMRKKSIQKRFSLKNPELITQFTDKDQSILLAMSHYANWEWAAPGLTSALNVKTIIVYKPLTNTSVEKIINGIRSQYGAIMVPMKQTIRTILEHQGETTMSILVSDQTPSARDNMHFVDFLNQPTAVFQGLEKIAKLTKSPVVYMNVVRVKRGYYEAVFTLLEDKPLSTADNEITEKYNKELENIILADPAYWLWSHKRWKHQPKHS